jgi:hypothetical protein
MKIKLFALLVLCFTSSYLYAGAIAPTVTPGITIPGVSKSDTDTENRAYAGLIWTLKDKASWIPDLTLGFRSLRVKSSDSVNGGDLSTRIKLSDGIAIDSVVLSYVGGKRDLLGNLGVGYSLTNASILGTAAVQAAYTKIGTDFQFNDKRFVPYIQLLTLDKPNNVNKISTPGTTTPSTLTCTAPLVLVGNNCESLASPVI